MKKSRKGNGFSSTLWGVIAVLIVFELLSGVMLSYSITRYTQAPKYNFIPLINSSENTEVKITGDLTALAEKPVSAEGLLAMSALMPGIGAKGIGRKTYSDPHFQVEDDEQVWKAEGRTDIEIFKISYDNNGDAVFTVNSENGDKVIAPGTGFDYEFTLVNDGGKDVSYTFVVEAYFEGTDEIIPVEAKLQEKNGEYLLGAADEWKPVLELDGITKSGQLSAGYLSTYKLSWQWPFERFDGEGLDANDAFDTMLGNLAADGEDLELHIIIKTLAEADEDVPPTTGEEPPQTGDSSITVWAILAVAALALIIFLPIISRRKNGEGEEAEA